MTEPDDGMEMVHAVKRNVLYEKLGWDTMASINVARDKHNLDSLRKLHSKRTASGMGGTLPITHQGYNSKFGLQMHIIEGGQTPNIKSVGQSLQKDGDGTEYVAIFTANGATQMSLTKRAKLQIMQILNEAEAEDRIMGTAIQSNGIYEEHFGEIDQQNNHENDQAYAVTSMYTHRVPMGSADDIIGMLASAGVKEEHILTGIRQKSIKGLPECANEEAVIKYFKLFGKDEDVIMAEIANAPLKTPIDYEPDVFVSPGEHLQMDNLDPSFARVVGEKKAIRSIGGFKDAVVVIDNCGFSAIHGRTTKKDPHLIVGKFISRWIGRWQSLRKLSADKEFITVESVELCKKLDIQVRQAVPYDHRRGLGASEGLNRWLQDSAQAHMNRRTQYVKSGIMTEVDKRSLWYHALTFANDVKLLAPSKCDPTKTQYEEGQGVAFNFSKHVILPFGMQVIVRKKQGDQDGRGLGGIYVGFSKVVVGGIMVYLFVTKRVVQKYTFVPRDPMPQLADIDVTTAARTMYGDLLVVEDDNPTKNEIKSEYELVNNELNNSKTLNSKTLKLNSELRGEHEVSKAEEDGQDMQKKSLKKNIEPREHYTRSKKKKVLMVLNVSSERPPKPKIPTRNEARKCPRWKAAFRREIHKLNEENTMSGLSKDTQGRYIRPEGAIVMRLIAVLEWKWKPDPDSGLEGWLECVRIVCDGSADKRENEVTYAETPDRALLNLILSIEAILKIKSKLGDAIRAYLNADSIDKNLVVIADRDMIEGATDMDRLNRESLLLKGLYGSIKGALSFQVWADMQLAKIQYVKCDVARGVYMKTLEDDIIRLYRHSDDFRISMSKEENMDKEIKEIQSVIRTTPFVTMDEFLGVEYTRCNSTTMVEEEDGNIYIATMKTKITKLETDFGYLRKHMNPTGRVRYTPLPLKPYLTEEELTDAQKDLLPEDDIKLYMSLVMSMGWIIGNIRPNMKYTHHILTKRLANPRLWDMYLAVWAMEHIILTKEWPLILGGSKVDPEVHADASFATMEERRSVVGHTLRAGPNSGVIYANVKTVKVAVKSVWEAETYGSSDGMDTAIYARRAVEELKYPSEDNRIVYVDNTAAIDWMLGSVPTKRSKHVETRMYRSRHLVDEGKIVLEKT